MKITHHILCVIILSINILTPKMVFCFEDKKTHPALTEKASRTPKFENYLINTLGIPEGLDKRLHPKLTNDDYTLGSVPDLTVGIATPVPRQPLTMSPQPASFASWHLVQGKKLSNKIKL